MDEATSALDSENEHLFLLNASGLSFQLLFSDYCIFIVWTMKPSSVCFCAVFLHLVFFTGTSTSHACALHIFIYECIIIRHCLHHVCSESAHFFTILCIFPKLHHLSCSLREMRIPEPCNRAAKLRHIVQQALDELMTGRTTFVPWRWFISA